MRAIRFKAPLRLSRGLLNGGGAWKPVESVRSEESEPLDFQMLRM